MLKYLISLLIIFATPAISDVNYDPDTHTMEISGFTTSEMAVEVFIIMSREEVASVIIEGPGGDYTSGLYIGNRIREEGSTVIIREGTTCVSACAFSALGGSKIILSGELLFHTPFMPLVPSAVTILDIAQRHGEAYAEMLFYFHDNGYSMAFGLHLIKNTSPCRFVVITDIESIEKIRSADPTGPLNYRHTIRPCPT